MRIWKYRDDLDDLNECQIIQIISPHRQTVHNTRKSGCCFLSALTITCCSLVGLYCTITIECDLVENEPLQYERIRL